MAGEAVVVAANGSHAQSPIRVGTDCSGMGMALFAMRGLRVSFRHVFASDIDAHARDTMQANNPAENVFHDLRDGDSLRLPGVDLYVAGFPCQPFSRAGLLEGFAAPDGRGRIFFYIREYIYQKRPRVFILENVAGLLHAQGGMCFLHIWASLSSLPGYNIRWAILNTQDHGVPQNRPRIFFVGIDQQHDTGTFRFPTALPRISLDLFLDPRLGRPSFMDLPPDSQSTARSNVFNILSNIADAGHDPFNEPWAIDCDSSALRSRGCHDVSPCLTRSRGAGHWLTNRGRRMTVGEMLRLQGWDGPFDRVVSDRQLGQQLGNAMSVNVIERVLCNLLPAAGLWPSDLLNDRWDAGTRNS
jgi:DNA (cytosine-5)-methyltransferase 1